MPMWARNAGVLEPMVYAWFRRYEQLESADVKRLRHLEQKNGRRMKMVSERDLEA